MLLAGFRCHSKAATAVRGTSVDAVRGRGPGWLLLLRRHGTVEGGSPPADTAADVGGPCRSEPDEAVHCVLQAVGELHTGSSSMSSTRRGGALVSKYVDALPSQTGLSPDSGSPTTRLGGPNPSKPESLWHVHGSGTPSTFV